MLASSFVLLIPFALGLAIPVSLRFALGPERAQRFLGLGLPLAFLIAWGILVGPGWQAYDSLGRIGHIVFGGMLLGLALDLFIQRRVLVVTAGAIYLAICAWAAVNGGLWPRQMPSLVALVGFIGSATIAFGLFWRIDQLRRSAQPHIAASTATLLQVALTALSLAAVAAVVGDVPLRATAAIFALAIAGLLVFGALFALELANLTLLVAAGGLFAIAWALIERTPGTAVGVGVSVLILFADGTVRRVPLPQAGISRFLYPLILAATALGPILLAVLLTVAVRAS